ncbi:hypothetical protein HK100_012452 [Physocladia obscura]|uniref:Uncharacterized protein n=1 Tax=Physocladia obscura TaxID=109957 RepID=A0AAD5XCG6_9FUNG|nr:hypothetical protein HK100_012452 [Physocladia obscura]
MAGWTNAVAAFDKAFAAAIASSNVTALSEFKARFWMQLINNPGDIASIATTSLATTVQYGPQYNYLFKPTSNSAIISNSTINANSATFGLTFLDAICNGIFLPAFTSPNATNTQLLEALQDLTTAYLTSVGAESANDGSIASLNTVNITDRTLSNNWFLWDWQFCNEFGYFQVSQNLSDSTQIHTYTNWTVYSQFITVDYYSWLCETQGLSTNGLPNVTYTLKSYNGLNITTPRIMWVNGDLDPWHWLSNYNTAPNPTTQALILYKNATHCNDIWVYPNL